MTRQIRAASRQASVLPLGVSKVNIISGASRCTRNRSNPRLREVQSTATASGLLEKASNFALRQTEEDKDAVCVHVRVSLVEIIKVKIAEAAHITLLLVSLILACIKRDLCGPLLVTRRYCSNIYIDLYDRLGCF